METKTHAFRTETHTEPCGACHGDRVLFTREPNNDDTCPICNGTGLGRTMVRYFVDEQPVSAEQYVAAMDGQSPRS